MQENHNYFKIEGLWENKMQKLIYDCLINAGPVEMSPDKKKLIDKKQGYQSRLGLTSKSTLYDILGYVDKDAEKWYSSWTIENKEAKVKNSISSIDIYTNNDGKSLYDIQ
jgi:hypothetical protein